MSSSRRPGRLAANLQGIWNETMWAPWEADYHLNINLQMNYWPAEATNLSETLDPLSDWFGKLTDKGKVSARRLYDADGWMTFTATNPFGRTTPSGSTKSSQFQNDPKHRHVSHLIGLHPFSLIGEQDAHLLEAARRTLNKRGFGGDVGWSNAWKICFFARLGDAEQAHWYLNRLISRNTFDNLMNACWPGRIFQIDGNFSGTAGITEMLLQSHGRQIHLLPALPAAWPDGKVTGLRARGGCEVDIYWEGGKLKRAVVKSLPDGPVRIRYEDERRTVDIAGGRSYSFVP